MSENSLLIPSEKKFHPKTYPMFVGYAFSINYLFGVGALGLPHAFHSAGEIMASFFLVFVTLICMITLVWLLDVQARVESYVSLKESNRPHHQEEGEYSTFQDPKSFSIISDHRKFEVNELCQIFLGKWGERLYELALFCYMTTGLWSFSTIFATSLTSKLPILGQTCDMSETNSFSECYHSYALFLIIFTCIVVPLACLDFTEQVPLQVILCACRFLVIGLMLITILAQCIKDGAVPSYSSQTTSSNLDVYFNFSGFFTIFSTLIYYQNLHPSVPILSHYVREKYYLRRMFFGALITTLALYLLEAIGISLYFGSNTKSMVTLNWEYYTGDGFPSSPIARPWWATSISYFILIFPALNVISAFPLGAITLGNGILAALPNSLTKNQTSKIMKILCRIVASFLPIICAAIVWNLTIILEIGGLFGFFIVFIMPALLQLASTKKSIFNRTIYSWEFSKTRYVIIILILGTTGFLLSIVELFLVHIKN